MTRTARSESSRTRRRRLSGPLASVLAAIAVAFFVVSTVTGKNDILFDALEDFTGRDGSETADDTGPATREDVEEARERLAETETADPEPRDDYERDEFGSSWVTAGNGCPTRHAILVRDLENVDADDDCTVLSGVFDDPYTGEQVEFTAEDPQAVQIDHVVPLSLAWRMGAAEWDRDQRVEFANDPRNLLAADGPANMSKGDSGPGEWRPYEGYQCSYAVTYIDVTHHYDLPLAPEDREGLEEMLGTCA
ncbi:HNH endonuclease family protein [Allosalinactinospora lopnorensis]|uniref:HNH endonuclease family protein n=1 Tax=Allosalinactinospora lopnorensis TaxID=1352348 RepID=UPI000623F673|nr:HNH endonuclease family protein [Allosalinactinospora lopnorensis]